MKSWAEFGSPQELCEWLLLAGKKLNKDKCNPEYVCCDGIILKQNEKGEWENDRGNNPSALNSLPKLKTNPTDKPYPLINTY